MNTAPSPAEITAAAMTEIRAAVVIPFRDRGRDPLRQANLDRVVAWWQNGPWPVFVVSDGRDGDAQFNRHAAYNRGTAGVGDVDVIIYSEADMLLPFAQVLDGARAAAQDLGLVVPFDEYRYLDEKASRRVRDGLAPHLVRPQSTMKDGKSIGAVNIVSRDTLDAVGGWDEMFEGNWYDDSAMRIAFDGCTGPTRWVDGPAYHLYHLPGWKGSHRSEADKAATAANRARWLRYRAAANDPDALRRLTKARRP